MSVKVIKDPIYGYVEINSEVTRGIIDTACFQRLRNIRQTSYAPLYPASFHNRFVHSIGVYHLGQKAFNAAISSLKNSGGLFSAEELANIKRLFGLACLLHDVGHAPFSHTGELFFLADGGSPPRIYNKLTALVGDDTFALDVDSYSKAGKLAASHEIVSCIIALERFGNHIRGSFERDFFSRCVTGHRYINEEKGKHDILNCFIELLNSPIIDVDRLDYIIRDAQTIGFQSVLIDYERLLEGICIIEENGFHRLGFHKKALSIIENAIYAHDTQKKWIQNHPVILYEHFLLQHAMRSIDKYFADTGKRFFSYEALTREGIDFGSKGKVALLADEDVLYMMKSVCSDMLIEEYFARNRRRIPVWKSEAEYKALFEHDLGKKRLDQLERAFKDIEKYLIEHFAIPVIDDALLAYLQAEEGRLVEKRDGEKISAKDYANLMQGNTKIKRWAQCLEKIAADLGIPFDFVIISANKFKSGFLKQDLEKIRIVFPTLDVNAYIKDVSTILTSQEGRDSFFYLFYRKREQTSPEEKRVLATAKDIATALTQELFSTPPED